MASSNCAVRSACGALSPGGVSVGTRISSRKNATAWSCWASTKFAISSVGARGMSVGVERCGIEMFQKVQQHGGCGFRILRRHCFEWIVTDAAIAATHEQHGDRRDPDHLHRVVTGAAGQMADRAALRRDAGGKAGLQ